MLLDCDSMTMITAYIVQEKQITSYKTENNLWTVRANYSVK